MAIRAAIEGDLPDILVINKSVQAFPWSAKSLTDEFKNPHFKGWVYIHKKIAGYLLARVIGIEAEIMSLGVENSFQRHGFANALINHLLNELRGACDTIFLEVSHKNTGAIALYKRSGFAITSARKGYYPDGSDALCMKLEIAKGQ